MTLNLRHRFHIQTGISFTNEGKNQMRNTSSGKLTHYLYGALAGTTKNEDKIAESF
jgi:hypothetical protein